MARRDALSRLARREVLLALLAVLSILIGLYRLSDPAARIPAWVKALDLAIGLSFALDWADRTRRSARPLRYALTHAWEALTFVPYTLLPVPETAGGGILRGVRLIRFVRFVRYAAALKLGIGLGRLPRRMRYLQRVATHAQLLALFAVGVVIVALGAAGLLALEGAANPAFTGGYAGAFWWSLSLFTTVAYQVPAPATTGGHVVAGLLMVLGVGYVGVFTASLASALLRTPDEDAEGEA